MRDACPREVEIVASILDHAQPIEDDGLDAHVQQCASCRDVAMITRLMVSDRESTQVVRVPAAGQVWWRAAVRARLEAVHAAARPLTWSQGAAAACAVGLTIAAIGLAWPSVREVASWAFGYVVQLLPFGDVPALFGTTWRAGVLAMLVVTACLVAAPVAVYLVLSDE